MSDYPYNTVDDAVTLVPTLVRSITDYVSYELIDVLPKDLHDMQQIHINLITTMALYSILHPLSLKRHLLCQDNIDESIVNLFTFLMEKINMTPQSMHASTDTAEVGNNVVSEVDIIPVSEE